MACVRLAIQTRKRVTCGTTARHNEIHGIIGKPCYARKCKTFQIIRFRSISPLAHVEGHTPAW